MARHWRHKKAHKANNKANHQFESEKKEDRGEDDPVDMSIDRENLSPAQRYRAFQKSQEERKSLAGRFQESLAFELDKFQKRALRELEEGKNLLVAAPTGAGKTVIADFAMYLAQFHNVKAFYTTPIKALSNQKYHDLMKVYGSDRVGLLTGDMSINSQADIIVMTTEVLRNMLYEGSSSLRALKYVVLDEIHYLSDRMRGGVWEEVIIHLPASVKVVGLSATVSNVEDFADWIESVRGKTSLVVSENRPVPLLQEVMVQQSARKEPRLFDLYLDEGRKTINPALISFLDSMDKDALRRQRMDRNSRSSPSTSRRRGGTGRSGLGRHRSHQAEVSHYTPNRWALVDEMDFLGLLPAIYFIFSRNGCDQAVQQCMQAGLRLTTQDEAARIRRIVDSMVYGQLDPDDARALGFASFRAALEQGIGAHHAGMITLYRQIVEHLFELGLLKVVFATETLALGINMPARSVVVEKLKKFNGISHEPLSPGEFTQLTGRAGRRGIDTVGYAVVADHRGFSPHTLVALASKRVYPLHSSFSPSFNMAVNLLNSADVETVRVTLDHSFAQWEAAESAQSLRTQIRATADKLNYYQQAFACDKGDFASFMRLRMELTQAERHDRKQLKHALFSSPKEKARAVKQLDQKIAALRHEERNHPCRFCPDLQAHLTWGQKWARLTAHMDRLQERYHSRTGSVSRKFDRICSILEVIGYVRKDPDRGYRVTAPGQLLRRIYSERDILVAQVLLSGITDRLNPEELACIASGFVYEPRSRADSSGLPRHFPGGSKGKIAQTVGHIMVAHTKIQALCEDYGLEPLPEPDFGMCQIIYDWVSDKPLTQVLDDTDMTGGDFVRNCKRTVDILTQISALSAYLPNPETAQTADKARVLINKGIVSYSGIEGE